MTALLGVTGYGDSDDGGDGGDGKAGKSARPSASAAPAGALTKAQLRVPQDVMAARWRKFRAARA